MKYAIYEGSFVDHLCETTHLNRKSQDFKTTTRRTRGDATDRRAMKAGNTTRWMTSPLAAKASVELQTQWCLTGLDVSGLVYWRHNLPEALTALRVYSLRTPGRRYHSPRNYVGTTPTKILSPDSHAGVLQSQGTPHSVEVRPEHHRVHGG